MNSKHCKYCKGEFVPKHPKALFCSTECRSHNNVMEKRTCYFCMTVHASSFELYTTHGQLACEDCRTGYGRGNSKKDALGALLLHYTEKVAESSDTGAIEGWVDAANIDNLDSPIRRWHLSRVVTKISDDLKKWTRKKYGIEAHIAALNQIDRNERKAGVKFASSTKTFIRGGVEYNYCLHCGHEFKHATGIGPFCEERCKSAYAKINPDVIIKSG